MNTQNSMKTALLLGALTGLFVLIGSLIGGTGGMIVAFMFAIVLNMGAWYFSASLALRFSGAQAVDEQQAPELHRMVAQLAQNAGIPKPKVYIIQSDMPNAFATGRNPANGAVAATTGIMHLLSRDELAGVMAHEIAHIKNYDTLISSLAATIGGAISMLADMAFWGALFGGNDEDNGPGALISGFLLMITAPIAAMIIQMAISRAREFVADADGAAILGDPLALASALQKIEQWSQQRLQMGAVPHVNPATSHQYIINPLAGAGGLVDLFRTHPPTEERVRRLRELAQHRRAMGAA
ncbi:MAG: zinc metalloprotease HtpX [Anaerolineae bacterium]|nr:zinc metalloprotease HtpX [Anaerolineae bacterium]